MSAPATLGTGGDSVLSADGALATDEESFTSAPHTDGTVRTQSLQLLVPLGLVPPK